MSLPQDFKSLQEQIQSALVSVTQTSGQISAEDLNFQRSLDPAVGTAIDEQASRLISLSTSLIKSAASLTQVDPVLLKDIDDVDNKWRNVVDVVDSLLEKADVSLDEYTGVRKRKTPPTEIELSSQSKKKKNFFALSENLRNPNLLKPQLAFHRKPNNDDNSTWKPLLTSKPHATLSLEESLKLTTDERNTVEYLHPYQTEIIQLQYPDAVYTPADPIKYLPAESTHATFVDTYEAVLSMLEELRGAKEIAVDLEHHDAHSYVGLVSLMQISTREKDWIVDTLKPWREDLQVLNEVFADPNILKVFHGAYMDIVWLQRDLGLYVVGLFDTHYACRALGYPGGSLAYLLKRFVDFDADKKFQLADWRIRPLPDEMFFYARADTHYLLYIYDNLRNELLAANNPGALEESKIETVLFRSKETSLSTFRRLIYDSNGGRGPQGWYNMLSKTPPQFDGAQFAVFRAVHAWRDQIARKDDDSANWVMPNHAIFTLTRLIPTDVNGIYSAVHPISNNVKTRVTELLDVIKAAALAGKDGPTYMEFLQGGQASTVAKPQESKAEIRIAKLDPTKLTSGVSKFWGGAFGSSIWDPHTPATTNSLGLRLAVPLPPVESDSIQSFGTDTPSKSKTEPAQNATQSSSKQLPEANETEKAFSLKSGIKQKSQGDGVSPASEISLDEEEKQQAVVKAAAKAVRKAEKKAAKRAKKAAELAAAGVVVDEEGDSHTKSGRDDEEQEPYDYSKADSVLHAKPKQIVKEGKNGKNKVPFDPYMKSSDALGPMRRTQTERAGKSFTFKN